jgi:DNA-binding MarR family transcriptional regulator
MSDTRDRSTGELGDELGVQAWRINRLFALGLVEEPDRVAGRRMIPRSMVPRIVAALEERGWLSRHRSPTT